MNGFITGFIESWNNPMTIFIYLVIIVLGISSIMINKKVYRFLKSMDRDSDSHEIISKYDGSDIKSYVEKYFSNLKIEFIFFKKNEYPVIGVIDFTKMVVSLLIIVGVIGTFYSLVISFDDINLAFNSGLSSNPGNELGSIGDILSKMSIAFYTSILGMAFSILLSILLKLRNSEYLFTNLMYYFEKQIEISKAEEELINQEKSEQIINETFSCLMDTRNGIVSINNSLQSFETFTDELNNAAKSLRKLNKDLDQSVGKYDELFRGFGSVVGSFESGITQLNSNFVNLFSYFDAIEKEKHEYNLNLKHQNEFNSEQLSAIKSIQNQVTGSLENSMLRNDSLLQSNENLISDIAVMQTVHTDELNSIYDKMLRDFKESNDNMLERNLDMQNKIYEENNKLQERIVSSSQETQSEIANRINELNERLLTKNSEVLTEINNLYKGMDSRMKDNDELSIKLMEGINNGFISNLNEFEDKINIFNERLQTVVGQIDTSLGKNIDRTLRDFSKYLDISNKLLDNEIASISRFAAMYEKTGDKKIDQLYNALSSFSNELKQIGDLLKENTSGSNSTEKLTNATNFGRLKNYVKQI